MEYKDLSNQKIVKVNCDFCGKAMECPEDMLKTSEKHMCSTCFKNADSLNDQDLEHVHVDLPKDELEEVLAGNFTDDLTEKAFPMMWSREKNRLRKLSKKEMSQEVFAAGVYMGIQTILDYMKSMDEDDEEIDT